MPCTAEKSRPTQPEPLAEEPANLNKGSQPRTTIEPVSKDKRLYNAIKYRLEDNEESLKQRWEEIKKSWKAGVVPDDFDDFTTTILSTKKNYAPEFMNKYKIYEE